MSISLLTTKLYSPPARQDLVPRPRLVEQLMLGLRGACTLISAPAGYGKTTLVSEWRRSIGCDYPLAWVTLDKDDNDPVRFLTYVAAALRTLKPGFGENALSALQVPQSPDPKSILTGLLNELDQDDKPFALALDDYHVIEDRSVHEALTFVLDHLPPQMHLLILTRADPPLPLSRLRARGQLAEIRAADLRFTLDEATRFLNHVMGLGLSIGDVKALEQRTEGWIAGLQLAALSMQGREDAPGFVRAFTGSYHYIVDYLVDEVLSRQSEAIRDFLLKTSLLSRMTGPLCDALAGCTDGQAILHRLEHDNLFIIPLDNEQCWYRYHHLFADVLRKHFLQTFPETVPELYRRAAQWCEQNDMLEEAVEYALAAQDYPLAIRLIEFSSWRLVTRSSISVILRWMRALPQGLIQSRLRLCFNSAQALIEQGYFAEAEIFLQVIENALHENSFAQSPTARELTENIDPRLTQAAGGLSVVERLPILFNLLRCNIALLQENQEEAQVFCDQALQHIPSSDQLDHCVARLFSGRIAFMNGDHINATQCFNEAVRESQTVKHHSIHIEATSLLGLQAILEGKLHEAMSLFTESVRYAHEQPEPIPSEIEIIRIAYIQLEWNDLQAAAANIQRATHLAEATRDFTFRRECYVVQARLEQAYGNMEIALDYLQKAENVALNTQTRQGVFPIKPMQARLWIAMGNLEAARQWAATAGLVPDSALDFQHEYSFLTLARLLLAQGCYAEAGRLLERLQSFSSTAGRQGRVIENVMLQSLVHHASGKHELAIETLIEALRMAQTEGYIRLFVDEGEPMRSLISRCEPRIAKSDLNLLNYVHNLQSAFSPYPFTPAIPEIQSLLAPLSERELEILRLIATGCSNKEIAKQLVIAIGTVKRHTSNIFNKLGADNRTEAVAKARGMGLL